MNMMPRRYLLLIMQIGVASLTRHRSWNEKSANPLVRVALWEGKDRFDYRDTLDTAVARPSCSFTQRPA